jgi:hypothetical protein
MVHSSSRIATATEIILFQDAEMLSTVALAADDCYHADSLLARDELLSNMELRVSGLIMRLEWWLLS